MALIFLFSFASCGESHKGNSETVFTVNSTPVTKEEVDYFAAKHRTAVMSKYINEYDAVVDNDFWNTKFGETTPQEYLDSLVKKDAVSAKIRLMLCLDHGIYSDISYNALYNLALEYNEEHSGIKTVGLQTIPLESFYDYYIDNGVMELKNILGENELAPTEDEINEKLVEIKRKYSDKDEHEQLAIAKDIIVEEKYSEMLEEMITHADIIQTQDIS